MANKELAAESVRLAELRDELIEGVLNAFDCASLTGPRSHRLPNNAHFTFEGCSGDSLLFLLDQAGISVSTGSACQAGVNGPSHVLLAMGRSESEANACLRMTLGNQSTSADVDALLQALPQAVSAARKAG
jgi:cysteine desulfurase